MPLWAQLFIQQCIYAYIYYAYHFLIASLLVTYLNQSKYYILTQFYVPLSLPSLFTTAADVSSCPLCPPVPLLHKAVQEGDQQCCGDPHSPQPPAGGSCVPGGTTRPSCPSVCCPPDSPSIPLCSGIPDVAGREEDVSEYKL